METKYYIYHIPTFVHKDGMIGKIGVSVRPKRRIRNQKYSDYEILETHTDIIEVSRREIELQKQYGYKIDKIMYCKTLLNRSKEASRKVGKRNVESGHLASIRTKESCSKGGRASGPIVGKLSRKITFEDAQSIKELYSTKKYKQKELAKMYDMDQPSISRIINKKTYITP